MRDFDFHLFWTRRHVAIEMKEVSVTCVMTRCGIVGLHLREIHVKVDAQRQSVEESSFQ
jgi:hypothetical protein